MDEKEILAEKIRAIFTRNKPKDVYDLWFLVAKKQVPFKIDLINKKLKLYSLVFNFDDFIKAIEAKKGMWNSDLKNLIIYDIPDFGYIKDDLIQKIKSTI